MLVRFVRAGAATRHPPEVYGATGPRDDTKDVGCQPLLGKGFLDQRPDAAP